MTPPQFDDPYDDRTDPPNSGDELRSIDDDPTGMRAVLSSLPDPGPMPPEVKQRLWAALSHEQQARARGEINPVPLAAAPVHDLQAHREQRALRASEPARRPRRHHGLLVAAAVVGLAAVGGGGLVTAIGGPGAVINALDGTHDNAAAGASAQQESAEQDAAAPGATAAPPQAAPSPSERALDPGEVRVVSSDEAYASSTLASQAGDTVKRAPILVPAQETGPLATPTAVRACAAALGVPVTDGVLVDLAQVDGKPAAVVIRQDASGRLTAYAVARTCTTGSPATIAGPVDLP